MKIPGMGVPELVIIAVVAAVIILIVTLVRKR